MPDRSGFEFELAIEKLKRHKSPGADKIPAELIKTRVQKFVLRPIILLILFGIRRNFLSNGRSRVLYLFIRRSIKEFVVIIETYHFRKIRTNFYPTSCCQW